MRRALLGAYLNLTEAAARDGDDRRQRESCLTEGVARRAGGLLARAGLGSAYAVDAFVVATRLEFCLAMIATGDPDDLRRLAKGAPSLRILSI